MTTKPLILASRSPRRMNLLEQFSIPHIVIPSDCLETPPGKGETPIEYAIRLALQKALNVASRHPADVILGADTIVVDGSEILGKPQSVQNGSRMMERLSGRNHLVITGLSLIVPMRDPILRHAETQVEFRQLSNREIEWYCNTGDGLDKAGGYGIQSLGGALIRKIQGDWFNVVGLPVSLLIELLMEYCPEYWPPPI